MVGSSGPAWHPGHDYWKGDCVKYWCCVFGALAKGTSRLLVRPDKMLNFLPLNFQKGGMI